MSWLAPFSNVTWTYQCCRRDKFKFLHEAHERLGPIVRTGPNAISFRDLAGVKDIYGHGSAANKDSFYDRIASTHRHLADVVDRKDHSKKRRTLAAAFSQSSLENWEHIVADRTAALLAQYGRLCETPEYQPSCHAERDTDPKDLVGCINHRQWMAIFAEDAIVQIGLSANLNLLEAGNDLITVTDAYGHTSTLRYRDAIWNSLRVNSWVVWSPAWWATLVKWTSWHPGWQHDKNFNAMCFYLVQERLKRHTAGERPEDFFSFMLENKYGQDNLYPMGELVAETAIMLNAGSDTTGIALTNVLYWLLKNPTCLEKLRAEIDSVADNNDIVIPYDQVKHLPYLRACLDESMRLTPPNTMSVPRLTPPNGMYIMGHWIPGNTTVHSPPYSMHRQTAIFPDPEAYIPDRWLGEKGRDLQGHFLIFSAGSRGCIGRNITYLEQIICLGSLVHRYDFELPRPDWVLRQEETFTCSPRDFPVRIRRRELKG